jgi:hypothetical protein
VFRTPENVGHAVVDLQLREKEEENKTLLEKLETITMKEKEMTRQISDFELRLEAANHEAWFLKTSNIELVRNVCTFINIFFIVVAIILYSTIFVFLILSQSYYIFSPCTFS